MSTVTAPTRRSREPAPPPLDPAELTPAQWTAKLAAYLSRGRSDDDPAVIRCREALAYWRVRRVLDRQAGQLSQLGTEALVGLLRSGVPV